MRRGATGEIVKAKVVSSNHFGHEYDLTSVHREVLGYVVNRFKDVHVAALNRAGFHQNIWIEIG